MSAVHPGQYRGPCGRGIFALSSWKVPLKRPESLRESKAGKISDFKKQDQCSQSCRDVCDTQTEYIA